jgi:uncharacterized protein YdhG (YjbR/CyaY superfamily)
VAVARLPDDGPGDYGRDMAQSAATTVEQYLEELPPQRAEVVAHVRDLVNANLPEGYEEGMSYGMISWSVPLSAYPDTYNGKPLAYVSLAAQKHYYALYLMGVYADSEQEAQLREQWQARGTKLDMGRSCLRFKRLEDLHEDLVADVVAAVPMDEYVAAAKAAHARKR